jgi:hypothetical protein
MTPDTVPIASPADTLQNVRHPDLRHASAARGVTGRAGGFVGIRVSIHDQVVITLVGADAPWIGMAVKSDYRDAHRVGDVKGSGIWADDEVTPADAPYQLPYGV